MTFIIILILIAVGIGANILYRKKYKETVVLRGDPTSASDSDTLIVKKAGDFYLIRDKKQKKLEKIKPYDFYVMSSLEEVRIAFHSIPEYSFRIDGRQYGMLPYDQLYSYCESDMQYRLFHQWNPEKKVYEVTSEYEKYHEKEWLLEQLGLELREPEYQSGIISMSALIQWYNGLDRARQSLMGRFAEKLSEMVSEGYFEIIDGGDALKITEKFYTESQRSLKYLDEIFSEKSDSV